MFSNDLWNKPASASGFYSHQIEQSCRFDGSTSFLSKTFSGAGNRRTGSFSVWVKRSLLSTQQMIFNPYVSNGDQDELLQFNSSSSADHADSISQWWDGANSGDETSLALFRDVSGWNHFLLAWDTTQGTDTNRVKLYLNGSQITDFETYNGGTVTYPSQNYDTFAFGGNLHEIGRRKANTGNYFNGYLAEIVAIDGTQVAPTDLGEYKGGNIWIPKDPSGLTFGTNGFYLKFKSGAIGTDSSGNGNTFSTSGLTDTNIVLDSPTFGS
ncbi:spry domain protein [uncultured Mediterranean phage uvMED]|nr:spry domain protein [uncultured Mediterranean phage uvMED]